MAITLPARSRVGSLEQYLSLLYANILEPDLFIAGILLAVQMENKRTFSPGELSSNVNKKRNMRSSPDLDGTILEDSEDHTFSIEKTIQAALEKLLKISLEKIIPVIIQN